MGAFGIVALFTGVCVLSSPAALRCGAADQDRGRPPGASEVQQPAKELPQAFITSKRVVYGYGQPVDLTFSIATPKDGTVLPDFRIERVPRLSEPGVNDEPRAVDGLHFWEAPGESLDGKRREGALPAGQTYTETIADLRQWYDLDAPGTYRVTFGGEWIDAEDERHALTSNAIIVRCARPPSEEEPFGEPTEGHIVPLSEIWGTRMSPRAPLPGTKPLAARVGAGGFRSPDCELVEEIHRVLSRDLQAPAMPAYLVTGREADALRRAHSVLVENAQSQSLFRNGEVVWLIFFARGFPAFVNIESVTNHGDIVHVSYSLVVHGHQSNSTHLAMIPVRLQETGIVRIEIQPVVSPDDRFLQGRIRSFAERVSQSFQFEVVE